MTVRFLIIYCDFNSPSPLVTCCSNPTFLNPTARHPRHRSQWHRVYVLGCRPCVRRCERGWSARCCHADCCRSLRQGCRFQGYLGRSKKLVLRILKGQWYKIVKIWSSMKERHDKLPNLPPTMYTRFKPCLESPSPNPNSCFRWFVSRRSANSYVAWCGLPNNFFCNVTPASLPPVIAFQTPSNASRNPPCPRRGRWYFAAQSKSGLEKYNDGWPSCWYPRLGRAELPFRGEIVPKIPAWERIRSRMIWMSSAQSRESLNTKTASILRGFLGGAWVSWIGRGRVRAYAA